MGSFEELTAAEMLAITGGSSCPPWPSVTVTDEMKFQWKLDVQLHEYLEEVDFYYENFNWFE